MQERAPVRAEDSWAPRGEAGLGRRRSAGGRAEAVLTVQHRGGQVTTV